MRFEIFGMPIKIFISYVFTTIEEMLLRLRHFYAQFERRSGLYLVLSLKITVGVYSLFSIGIISTAVSTQYKQQINLRGE